MGTIIAQTIHAAGESSPGNLPPETRAVALAVPDETSLLVLEQELIAAGVKHWAIREPDAPHHNALMAIGILPQAREPLRPLLGKLDLFK